MIIDGRVIKKRKDYMECIIRNVKYVDPYRADATPVCPHYRNPADQGSLQTIWDKVGCGGCKRQVMSYPHQLELKQQLIDDGFRQISQQLAGAQRKPMIPSPLTIQYRNKIEFSFGNFIVGQKMDGTKADTDEQFSATWNLGFHKQGQFSKVLDIDQCFLISSHAHTVFAMLKKHCKQSWLPVYDQKRHMGFFRHMVIREGVQTGQLMVNLVISDEYLATSPSWQISRDLLKTAWTEDKRLREHITTFMITTNNGLADIVKTQDSAITLLRGEGYIHEKLNLPKETPNLIHQHDEDAIQEHESVELTFRIGPFSFFQTNTYAAEKLFATAMNMLGEVSGTILDLYCGAGTIGLSFLKAGKGDKIVGIEIVPEAVLDAQVNAMINGLVDQTYFVAGKAEKVIKQPDIAHHIAKLSTVIVDPPRDGMHPDMIPFLLDLKKQFDYKLCYISCNPVTLARDLKLLCDWGLSVRQLQPVDMFPHTHHVEMIAILG